MTKKRNYLILGSLSILLVGTAVAVPLLNQTPVESKVTASNISTVKEPISTSFTFVKDENYKSLTGKEYVAYLEEEARKAEEARLAEEARIAAEAEAARKAEAERIAAEEEAKAIKAKSNPIAPIAGTPDPGSAKAYALQKVTEKGWSSAEYDCLVSLWNRESGWNHYANNPSSGAYGIPQSLPGNKMASFGADWQTNYETQINWGLDYIAKRYGAPCGAWAHSEQTNWY